MSTPAASAAAFSSRPHDLHAGYEPRPAPIGVIFALAKEIIALPTVEIEQLLTRADHESRVGAVRVMVWQPREK